MVDELYENNTIDVRGGASSTMQLGSTSFNTTVRNNHLLGGRAVIVQGVPTEVPGVWGWSHCPLFDFVFQGNTLEDVREGFHLGTDYSRLYTKNVPGRLYATASVLNNSINWTDAFGVWKAAHPPSDLSKERPLHAIVLGSADAPCNTDWRVTLKGNSAKVPPALSAAASVLVVNGTINGVPLTDHVMDLKN